jgi:hypothetical protein
VKALSSSPSATQKKKKRRKKECKSTDCGDFLKKRARATRWERSRPSVFKEQWLKSLWRKWSVSEEYQQTRPGR